ncbi:hypothetical protein K1719_042536 [Acacia pycnantha]|nr:hypothetical protein K1719_042536 [Acacia pycnantha]
MAFWTDQNVKRRVSVEKRSKKGLLLRNKPRQQLPQASVPPSTSFDPDTMLTHPVVRSTYAWLLYNLQQEMLALQHTLPEEAQHDGEVAYNQPTTSDESDDDDGDGHDTEEEEHREVKEPDQDVKEPALELRRSQRVVIPSSVLKSPWIEPKRKSKGKRTYDEKDTLFEMCTKSVPRDEAAEEFVDMHHYFLTREELQCLTPRSWINNKENPTLKTTKKKTKTVLDKSKDLMANKVISSIEMSLHFIVFFDLSLSGVSPSSPLCSCYLQSLLPLSSVLNRWYLTMMMSHITWRTRATLQEWMPSLSCGDMGLRLNHI